MPTPPALPKESTGSFYLDDNGQPAGPFSVDQIKDFIAQGRASLDHLASTTGDLPWQPLRNYPEFQTSSLSTLIGLPWFSTSKDTVVTVAIDFITRLLTSPLGSGPGAASFYEEYQNLLGYLGAYGLILCGLLVLLTSLILTIKVNSAEFFIGGIFFLFVMILGHYLAVKFNRANRTLLRGGWLQLGSDAVPSTLAVISLLLVVVMLLAAVGEFFSLATSNFFAAVSSLLFFSMLAIVFYHLAFLARNCTSVLQTSTESRPISGGEAFLALQKYLLRSSLALALVCFGPGVIFGFILLFVESISAIAAPTTPGSAPEVNYSDPLSNMASLSLSSLSLGLSVVFFFNYLPLLTYYGYLLGIYLVDLGAAIFRTANNTDRIKS